MRRSRHAPFNPNPVVPEFTRDRPPQPDRIADGLTRLAASVERLTTVLEYRQKGLGGAESTRYTSPPEQPKGLVDEKTMARILNISQRTLGRHRRDGRLPACWVRNGGRISWRGAKTLEAWERGIA